MNDLTESDAEIAADVVQKIIEHNEKLSEVGVNSQIFVFLFEVENVAETMDNKNFIIHAETNETICML